MCPFAPIAGRDANTLRGLAPSAAIGGQQRAAWNYQTQERRISGKACYQLRFHSLNVGLRGSMLQVRAGAACK